MTDKSKITPPGVYDLKLGEVAFIGPYEFTRVPGGWLVITIRGLVFVPFDNDLMPRGVADDIPF